MRRDMPAWEWIYWQAYYLKNGPFWWRRADWHAAIADRRQSTASKPVEEYLLEFEFNNDDDDARLAKKLCGAGMMTEETRNNIEGELG